MLGSLGRARQLKLFHSRVDTQHVVYVNIVIVDTTTRFLTIFFFFCYFFYVIYTGKMALITKNIRINAQNNRFCKKGPAMTFRDAEEIAFYS